jgi:cytochrome o ubiquinol oxidase subunit 2
MEQNKTRIKHKKHKVRQWPLWVLLIPIIYFALLMKFLLSGKNIALLNPKGQIAQEQFNLMVYVVIVLLTIAIPTLIVLYSVAYKYRESNTKAVHYPPNKKSHFPVLFMWLIPVTVAIVIATAMWPATHRLAPQKSIASDVKPLTIQVVSMNWKWLFLYPEQQIATVNFIQIPVNTPVRFELTADESPMSSFWIPNLGGQLYSMTSHNNLLNLMAEIPGDYPGSSAEINGAGFAGMRFTTRASSNEDFERWVNSAKLSPNTLDSDEYKNLLVPSEEHPVTLYSSFKENLFSEILLKYNGGSHGHAQNDDEPHEEENKEDHDSSEGHSH